MPDAMERYEEALGHYEIAVASVLQPDKLQNNDIVQYGDDLFAKVDTAFPQFGDYLLADCRTGEIVQQKVGKYDEVQRRFKRKEIQIVPSELFDLRLACLNNLTLVALKIAKGSQRQCDFEETLARADAALAMDGKSAKALMRMGTAFIETKRMDHAAQVLTLAAQETRGKDAEVNRLLEQVMVAKGKGGKGKRKGKDKEKKVTQEDQIAKHFSVCASCGKHGCNDPECGDKHFSSSDEEEAVSQSWAQASSRDAAQSGDADIGESGQLTNGGSTETMTKSSSGDGSRGDGTSAEDTAVAPSQKSSSRHTIHKQSSLLIPIVVAVVIALLAVGGFFVWRLEDSANVMHQEVEL